MNLSNIAIYIKPKMIAIFFLGIASGLPLALTASTLVFWLKESEVSLTLIGLVAAVGTPYTIKFLWAPLVDRLQIPILSQLIGQRRAWMVISQIVLISGLVAIAFTDPKESFNLIYLLAFIVATASATQDIVIDAYRVEMLEVREQGVGAATIVFGYRIGMYISGAIALFIAGAIGWKFTYLIMAAIVPIGIIAMMLLGEPKKIIHQASEQQSRNFSLWFKDTIITPITVFMQTERWALILCFIILYKVGDAFAGFMTAPFVSDIGFSKEQYAAIVKTYGLIATFVGLFIGGTLIHALGIKKCLLIGGLVQMFSNLVFMWQAEMGNEAWALMVTISVENLSGGLGTAAFVAYISALCHRDYTATHYALFSALAATARTWLNTPSGWVVEQVGWNEFFLITVILCIPALLLWKFLPNAKQL